MLLDGDNDKKRDSIVPYISSRYITNSATTKSILDELKGIAKPSKGSDQERKNNETQYAQIKAAIDSIYEKWFEETYGKVNNKLLIVDDNAYGKHKKQSSQNTYKRNYNNNYYQRGSSIIHFFETPNRSSAI